MQSLGRGINVMLLLSFIIYIIANVFLILEIEGSLPYIEILK